MTPGLPARMKMLWDTLPFDARRGAHLAAALMGFALMLLAHGLWRRKTASWALAVGALLLSAIAHLLKGLDYEESLVALALAAWLWMARRQFFARSDPPSMRRGLQVLAAAAAFTLFYGTLGFYLLDEHFQVNFDLLAALRQTVAMFFSDPGLEPIRRFGRFFADSISTYAHYPAGLGMTTQAISSERRKYLWRAAGDFQATLKIPGGCRLTMSGGAMNEH